MTLVDTSSWIEALRPRGRDEVKDRVLRLLEEGQACWCDVIRLELWNSRSDDRDQRILHDLDVDLPTYAIDERVWRAATDLAKAARTRGFTVPAVDLLIFECARLNGLKLESADKHFKMLEQLYQN